MQEITTWDPNRDKGKGFQLDSQTCECHHYGELTIEIVFCRPSSIDKDLSTINVLGGIARIAVKSCIYVKSQE